MIILIFLLERYSQNLMHTVMIQFFFLSKFYYSLCNTQYCLPKIKRHTEFFIPLLLYYSSLSQLTIPQHTTHFFPSLFTVMKFFQTCQVYVYSWQKISRKFIFSSKTFQTKKKTHSVIWRQHFQRGKATSEEEM